MVVMALTVGCGGRTDDLVRDIDVRDATPDGDKPDVVRSEDALMIQLPGIPPLRLRPETDHDFFIAENTRVTVTFESEPDGGVTRLLLRSPSGDTVAARVEGR